MLLAHSNTLNAISQSKEYKNNNNISLTINVSWTFGYVSKVALFEISRCMCYEGQMRTILIFPWALEKFNNEVDFRCISLNYLDLPIKKLIEFYIVFFSWIFFFLTNVLLIWHLLFYNCHLSLTASCSYPVEYFLHSGSTQEPSKAQKCFGGKENICARLCFFNTEFLRLACRAWGDV